MSGRGCTPPTDSDFPLIRLLIHYALDFRSSMLWGGGQKILLAGDIWGRGLRESVFSSVPTVYWTLLFSQGVVGGRGRAIKWG